MKHISKSSIFKLIFFFFFLSLITNSLFAQPQDNSDPDQQAVPIDGGVLGLAAVGISYGIKSYRDKKKSVKK